MRVQKRFSLFLLGHLAYVGDMIEEVVGLVMVIEIHLF